jgi:hypothetical protein
MKYVDFYVMDILYELNIQMNLVSIQNLQHGSVSMFHIFHTVVFALEQSMVK